MKREKENYLIQAVSHAIDVLEELAKSQSEVGVTELSKRLRLHKNNVFRLLATLELRGYAEQNKDSEDYRLGSRVLQLGQAYLAHSKLVARATPILRDLADALGETASLAVMYNGQVQFPICFESKRPVRVSARSGCSLAAKQCAVGRLLTAQLADSILAEILASNTAQDAAIKSQLNDLRSSGLIVDKGALEPDVVSIAKLVRGEQDEALGAIEIMIPQYRAKIEILQPALEEAAQKLSNALGAGLKGSLVATIERDPSIGSDGMRAKQQ